MYKLSVLIYVFYVFGVLRGHKVFTVSSLISSLLPANYFLILYSVLYIISPYLNLIIKQLNKEQFKRLLIILMLIFSVWTIVIDIAENITGNTYLGLNVLLECMEVNMVIQLLTLFWYIL